MGRSMTSQNAVSRKFPQLSIYLELTSEGKILGLQQAYARGQEPRPKKLGSESAL